MRTQVAPSVTRGAQARPGESEGEEPGVDRVKALPPGVFEESPLVRLQVFCLFVCCLFVCLDITWDLLEGDDSVPS